jgi:hypothetical protein
MIASYGSMFPALCRHSWNKNDYRCTILHQTKWVGLNVVRSTNPFRANSAAETNQHLVDHHISIANKPVF